jgi:hypothetical protein
MSVFSIWVTWDGIPVAGLDLSGPYVPPPIPNCIPVLIASDSEGYFAHQCPECDGYWRSRQGGVFTAHIAECAGNVTAF